MRKHKFDETGFCHGCAEYIENAAQECIPKTEREIKERYEKNQQYQQQILKPAWWQFWKKKIG
jgi:hypothetical protein